MNDKKQFLLEWADLMDKYGIKDIELDDDGYCTLDINFKGFDVALSTSHFSLEFDDRSVTPSDIRQKAEEL